MDEATIKCGVCGRVYTLDRESREYHDLSYPKVGCKVCKPKKAPKIKIHKTKQGYQRENKFGRIIVVIDGEDMTLSEACRELGISYPAVYNRLREGWDLEKAISTPVRKWRD